MKKLISGLILFIFFLLAFLILILSTFGIETNKFNNLITNKVSETKNIDLELDTVKFKIDLQELSLFLETKNPIIKYKKFLIPINNVRSYIDFISLLKIEPKIKKTIFIFKELDIAQLNNLSFLLKPSNFKTLLNNRVTQGKLKTEIEVFLNEKGLIENFIARGKIKNLNAKLTNSLNLINTSFGFTADKNDVLLKNIFGDVEDIKISDGDIRLNFEKGIKLNSNFLSQINLNSKVLYKHSQLFEKFKFIENIKIFKANFNNSLSVELDKTYKITDYNYKVTGKLEKAVFELSESINSNFLNKSIKEIYLSEMQVENFFDPKEIKLDGKGKYSINNSDFLKINFVNKIKKELSSLQIDLDYKGDFIIDFINYEKSKNSLANLSLNLEKKDKNFNLKKFKFSENTNLFEIENLKIKENRYLSLKKVLVKTDKNDFSVQVAQDENIIVKGKKFDATNLAKLFKDQNEENKFEKLNGNVEIDFENIKVPMSENLKNFKLIGVVKKGKFIKISSKGDFGNNNYLDISMKKDKNSNKKYLEIYSDLTKPLLSEYSFFNGLSGGTLLFTSIIDNSKSYSKLKIENFKLINAPGVVKLLSLADLGGLADLAEGEGLTFDFLEVDMEKNKGFLKINEILALGPSMSVLMDGYQEKSGLTSLRGTLVPAKTLNKLISKIPVIGNIVIPKEVGEGLFGISFKMKGPKGKIKTIINPIRTLTPRFIQKIIEKNQQAK
tara:strand:- start:469 stop:2646 length:2178 start_codon:yes stop_codon:yes gene_type:complete